MLGKPEISAAYRRRNGKKEDAMRAKTLGRWMIVVFLAALLVLAVAPPASAAKMAFKVATLAPKDLGWAVSFQKYVTPWVQRSTNDQVVFKVYWGGVMGNDNDYLRKMRIGQLQGAGLSGQGSTTACPEFSVVGLPFLFNSFEEVDYIRAMMFSTFDYFFSENGYKLMLWIDQDFDLFYSTKYRFDRLDDFKAAKIVTWYGPQEAAMLKALGASPIPIAVTDIPASKRSGVIDTNIAPAIWQVGSQLYTIDRYVNTMKIRYSPATVVLTNAAWGQIPEAYQEKLLESQADVQKKYCADIRRDNERCFKAMLDYGVQKVTPSPEAQAAIQKRAMKVYDDMSGSMYPVELLQEVKKYLAAFRKGKPESLKAATPRQSPRAESAADKARLAEMARAQAAADAAQKKAAAEAKAEPAAAQPAAQPEKKVSAWAERKRQIMEVQKMLKGMGYYDDDVDGVIGPNTRKGVMQYQKAKGLPQTGVIDRKLLLHMGVIK